MSKSLSVHTLMKKTYSTYKLAPEWEQAIGEVEKNFKMFVCGPSGHGKTTYVLKLCKHLSAFGKVFFNSMEQGDSKSLQKAMEHCKLEECEKGSFIIGDRLTFEEMMQKLKKNRARFVVLDSLDYMTLTTRQYKIMTERYPRKAFIIISWSRTSGEPKTQPAKDIEYMADIKVRVKNGVATARGRFGHTVPYRIFEMEGQRTSPQLQISYGRREVGS